MKISLYVRVEYDQNLRGLAPSKKLCCCGAVIFCKLPNVVAAIDNISNILCNIKLRPILDYIMKTRYLDIQGRHDDVQIRGGWPLPL